MARPFSAVRHEDLITRVVRKMDRLAKSNKGDGVDYAKVGKQASTVLNYIARKDWAGGRRYMEKAGEMLQNELPETFETLKNQAELAKAKSKEQKKAA